MYRFHSVRVVEQHCLAYFVCIWFNAFQLASLRFCLCYSHVVGFFYSRCKWRSRLSKTSVIAISHNQFDELGYLFYATKSLQFAYSSPSLIESSFICPYFYCLLYLRFNSIFLPIHLSLSLSLFLLLLFAISLSLMYSFSIPPSIPSQLTHLIA